MTAKQQEQELKGAYPMSGTCRLLRIFVASPSDVAEERKIAEEVINEFNLAPGDNRDIRFELIRFETHTRPGFGVDAQSVINSQIGDEYDILLGIMWGRFGSSTNRAESGTEEEFKRAYSRLKSSPGSVEIMFYFKDAGIPPSKMVPGQLAKVQEFKKLIGSEYGGLYHEFETVEQFRTKLRVHLSMLVNDWCKGTSTTTAGTTTTPAVIADTDDSLANLTALADEDSEEGLIDLAERASDAFETVAGVLGKMTAVVSELGEKIQQRTKEINLAKSSGSAPDLKAMKRICSTAANDLDVYVNRMSVEIPEFRKQHSLAMDAFGRIAIISSTDLKEAPEDIKTVLAQLKEYLLANGESLVGLSGFREALASSPRMTTAYNRARNRAVAITDDLLVQYRIAANQVKDVVPLLERMLGDTNSSAESEN